MTGFTSEQVQAYAAYGLASALRDSLFTAYNSALENAASGGQEELLIPLLLACNEASTAVTKLRDTVKKLEQSITADTWFAILNDAQIAQPKQGNYPLDTSEPIITIDNRKQIVAKIIMAIQRFNKTEQEAYTE